MKANEEKTALLHRMSHDLRTPINAILGMLEIAERNAGDAEKQSYCRAQARTASEYLLELVNDILTVNRLENDGGTEADTVFCLADEAKLVYDMVSIRAESAGVIFKPPDVSGSGRQLKGNVLYFRQIVINIVTNAVKYTGRGGEVKVSFEERADVNTHGVAVVRFVCLDSGIGMSRGFRERMFEPFQQENCETVGTYGGIGLGLAIVKKLVGKLGGTISAESEKGKGTRFEITVPFAYSESEGAEENAEDGSLDRLRLLIAEDNSINMEIAEYLAKDAGAEVIKAYDGETAAEKFAESEAGAIDAILMDISMPGIDGLEVTERIRSMPRADAKTVPVIAMTANLFAEDKQKCTAAGMDALIPKPIDSAMLVRVVSEQVKKRRRSS